MSNDIDVQARAILAQVKPLASAYYKLTGRPLGCTGELAEAAAADKLGLKLADARTAGYDARRGTEKIQIKGRAFKKGRASLGRTGITKIDSDFDFVILVILDLESLDPVGMWQATNAQVKAMISKNPNSKGRARGQLPIAEFKSVATQIWPPDATLT